MQAVETPAQNVETAASPTEGERRCLATGEVLPKEQMVRFVVGPNAEIVPDLEQDLPGRGLWVKADSEAISEAAKKGLFTKAAKTAAKASPDLAAQVQKLLRHRCLSFVGLSKGAGITVLGEEQVGIALRKGELAYLLLADDAMSAKLDHRGSLPTFNLFTRGELGQALGYAQIVYAGLRPHKLTRRLASEIGRLSALMAVSTASPSQLTPKDG